MRNARSTWCILLDNLHFRPSPCKQLAGVFKTHTLKTIRFEKLHFFWCPKTSFTRGQKVKTEKKMPVFKNIQILVNWAFLMSARKLFERRGFTRDRERLIWAGFFASRYSQVGIFSAGRLFTLRTWYNRTRCSFKRYWKEEYFVLSVGKLSRKRRSFKSP